MSDKMIEHFFKRQAQSTLFFEHPGKNTIGDALAVYQYTVAIKND